MNAFDENNYEKAEIRHQYNLMMDLKGLMDKQKERLELQIRENYVSLINRKKSLYNQWVFGFVDFDSGIRNVNEYINKLKKKEIRKNAKCDEKAYYEIMMEHIESETGIKVKSIDDITFGDMAGGIIFILQMRNTVSHSDGISRILNLIDTAQKCTTAMNLEKIKLQIFMIFLTI